MGNILKMVNPKKTSSSSGRDAEHFRLALKTVLLVLAAGLIIGVSAFTLNRLDDRTVFTILVPGTITGIILIVLGLNWGKGDR